MRNPIRDLPTLHALVIVGVLGMFLGICVGWALAHYIVI